ncbi:MAG: pirin family protein [Flavobacteriales bacterium]
MATTIYTKQQQAFGSFSNGAILENKPIGFPQDRGQLKSYSNLFYWANAWSDNGGLIDEHPHKWFEILSFVIDGEIEHYDNKYKRWLKLEKGDVQIIRAGNGITHAEKILPNSRMFQIWFDPDITKTQYKEASYNDYKSNEFIATKNNNLNITNYTGNGGKLKMDAEGVVISKIEISKGTHTLTLKNTSYYSIYVLNSNGLTLNEQTLNNDDFVKLENEEQLVLTTNSDSEIFVIETPIKLSYVTYQEMSKF